MTCSISNWFKPSTTQATYNIIIEDIDTKIVEAVGKDETSVQNGDSFWSVKITSDENVVMIVVVINSDSYNQVDYFVYLVVWLYV